MFLLLVPVIDRKFFYTRFAADGLSLRWSEDIQQPSAYS